MKILLFGADGQVGFELLRALAPLGEVVATTRGGRLAGGAACEALDLADFDALTAIVRAQRPTLIVNAAAYTAVDRAEDEADLALRINGAAMAVLGVEARLAGARVVHYSTDYVFAGDGTRPWREDDPVAPINAYGRSKLAGEHALIATGCRHLILRTAWVYAARGQNFLRTMLRLAGERDRLTVVNDQRGAPTTARAIAECTAHALRQRDNDGVYHLAAAGETTWHGFAGALLQAAHVAGLIARVPEVTPIPSAQFVTKARRPAYSVLDCSRFRETFGIAPPDWRVGLAHVIGELAACGSGAARLAS
jgi:dTDP-4-dehydrorhamnose reductase